MTYTIKLGSRKLNWSAHGVDRILQNVQNLLSLAAYEVAFDRTRGLPTSLMDMPAGEAMNLFIAKATEQLQRFESRAKIISAVLEGVTADGQINYEVVIDIGI